MVLAPARSDLDRSHEGREPAGLFPVKAGGDAVENTGAIRVAAARGVHHFGRLNARDVDPLTVHVDEGPFRAPGKNERFELVRNLLELASGALLAEPPCVVVDRCAARLSAAGWQLFGVVDVVPGAAADVPPQLGNEEGQIQDVDLCGQDVLPETAAEYHDVVVRDRAADQDAHKKRGTWNDESREFADGTARLAGLFTRAFPRSSAVDFLATCCWEREA